MARESQGNPCQQRDMMMTILEIDLPNWNIEIIMDLPQIVIHSLNLLGMYFVEFL